MPQRGAVSIAGFQAMSIYANYTGASSTFNLVRVVPAAATKTLNIGFYDVGDASNPGTVQVLPPTDSNLGGSLSSCQGTGVVTGTISNCKLTNVYNGSGWERKLREHQDPDPEHLHLHLRPGGRLLVAARGGVPGWCQRHHDLDGQHRRK